MIPRRLVRLRPIHTRACSHGIDRTLCVSRNINNGSIYGRSIRPQPHHHFRSFSLQQSRSACVSESAIGRDSAARVVRNSLLAPNTNQICRLNTTHAAVQQKPKHHEISKLQSSRDSTRTTSQSTRAEAVELTQRLLSMPPSFEDTLANTRKNLSILQPLQISPEEAKNMFILPPDLLRDVHVAILHFSQKENFQGIAILPNQLVSNEAKPFSERSKKIPGPILCAKLLEVIGVPFYYHHVNSGDSASAMIVHSSQIDLILDCCLKTTIALSHSCETGKHSLIGSDFNLQSTATGERKLAAQLGEEIWRSVWNLQIKQTSGGRKSAHVGEMNNSEHLPQQIRIGRVGSIESGSVNPLLEYLSAAKDEAQEEEVNCDKWTVMGNDSEDRIPWSMKDQRRYDKHLILFNAVLASYAKLSSSASGVHPEVRRDMVKSAERLLLEVAQSDWRGTGGRPHEPSPSTVLQCLQPDVMSFNTTMKALSGWAPRLKRQGHSDEDLIDMDAKRTESILKMMQHLWDEERSTHTTTLQSVQSAWEKHGDANPNLSKRDGGGEWAERHAPPPKYRAIAPNTSSYNNVLKAWSRSSDPDAALRALELYQTMITRSNVACNAKETLILDYSEYSERIVAFPDSRTFVLLLQSLQNFTLSSFQDSLSIVEEIYRSTKQLDEQLKWSREKGKLEKVGSPILNVFSYNTLIKTISRLPANSWEESYQCCLQIDGIIEEMNNFSAVMQCLPNVITSWNRCAVWAKDRKRLEVCAEKCGALIESLLTNSMERRDGSSQSYIIRAINDTIDLWRGTPSKVDDLFLRAKACNHHNLGTLVNTINALCDSGDITYVEKAHSYLKDFEQMRMSRSRSLIVPDMRYTQMYNCIISGYIQCGYPEKAEALLQSMIASHEANPRHIARPNTTSFARVMSALSRHGDNSIKMEELLSKMEALHERYKSVPINSPDAKLVANVVPNIIIYNFLLKCYARRHDSEEALQSAMKLVGRMESNPDVQPDDVSNSYILSLSSRRGEKKSREKSNEESNELVGRQLTNLDMGRFDMGDLNLDDLNLSPSNDRNTAPNLDDLTSQSFKSIINVFSTSGTIEGAEKGKALLRKLEEMHRSGEIGFRPDTFLYNKVLNAYYICEQSNKDDSISPAEKAQELLDSLCEMGADEGHNKLHCNDVSFSTGIHAWCKSNRPDSAERAEQLLRRKEGLTKKFKQLQVKSTDYNAVISKWKDDPENGPKRATMLFEEMMEKYSGSEVLSARPTSATLNALLDVYAKCYKKKLAERAHTYLNRMNQLHKEGRGNTILPDVVSYRSVMDAWIRQWAVESPQKVDALLKEMIYKYKHEGREDLRPDSNALNLVLKACAHAPAMWEKKGSAKKGEDHPLAIANRIFSLMKGGNEYGATPTHVTYSHMFHAYRQHMDFNDERFPCLMQNLWKHCCRDGLVSELSLSSFRDAIQESEFIEAIGVQRGKTDTRKIKTEDLPKEWSRNVAPRVWPKT